MDNFGAPAPQSNVYIQGLMVSISKLPTQVPKWKGVSEAQLKEWFKVDEVRRLIIVLCKVADPDGDERECIIHPSEDVQKNSGFGTYTSHSNAHITVRGRIGFRKSEILDYDSAVEIIGDFLDPETKPLKTREIITIQPLILSGRCESIDNILDFAVFYQISYSKMQDPYTGECDGISVSGYLNQLYSRVEIVPGRTSRRGEVDAAVIAYTGGDSMSATNPFHFTTFTGLIEALEMVGLTVDTSIIHATPPTRLKTQFNCSIFSYSENNLALMKKLETSIDRLMAAF